jgi:hypothetical protein
VADADRLRVTLALDARAHHRARAILDGLQRHAADQLCLPEVIDEAGGRLVLDYVLDPGSLALAAAIPRWRAAPATYLPELVTLARYLATCVAITTERDAPVAIAPLFVRYTPASQVRPRGAFRLLAVPRVDCGLAEWARASCEAWGWLPGDVLLGRPTPHAGAYAIGAALHTVLAGDLFPVRSVAERFRRALRGQLGAPGAVGRAARAGLPASFGEEAEALQALVTALLAPEPPRDWRDQLARVCDRLDAHRVAVRWEYEHEIETARQILERLAATAPRARVPWEVLARLRGRDRDEAGELAAVLDAFGDGDPDEVRPLVAHVRRVAHKLEAVDAGKPTPCRDWIARAIAAVDRLGDRLGDLDRIHVAHVEARYLDGADRAKARLARRAAGGWDEILRRAVLARLHAATTEWPQVAKLCKDARLAVQAMPGAGGALGAYLIAYLDYLDGIAHFGAIGLYAAAGYLADAFERFVAALDGARAICAPGDPLVGAAIDWLRWLRALACQLQLPDARAIGAGITAYLAAHGVSHEVTGRGVPPLIWYDEHRLLPLSEASR